MLRARHFLFVAGTRPNFMKIAPLLRECEKHSDIRTTLVHTGQHYDYAFSKAFFDELHIKEPDLLLKAGDYNGEEQKMYIAEAIANAYKHDKPDVIIVVGDVRSTIGGALAGQLLNVPVAHVEAGLRSFDERMPEEHNRIATDKIATYLFASEPSGIANIRKEKLTGKPFLVGNVMIDTLMYELPAIKKLNYWQGLGLSRKQYVVVTLHRKENMEDPSIFLHLLEMVEYIASKQRVVWPLHFHTRKRLEELGLLERICSNSQIMIIEPLPYLEFNSLVTSALCLVTDSGGIQDETTYYNVPCLTLRRTTERPITARIGSSTLIGENGEKLVARFKEVLQGTYKHARLPRLWDGKTAQRIIAILDRELA